MRPAEKERAKGRKGERKMRIEGIRKLMGAGRGRVSCGWLRRTPKVPRTKILAAPKPLVSNRQ